MTTKFAYTPNYLVSPGTLLEETLEAKGIKKKEFAERCGRTAKLISEIIAGKAPITPETALQFERVLGVSARLWTNLESNYRLGLAEREDKKKLKKHLSLSQKFPIKELVKRGFLKPAKNEEDALSQLLAFFGVGTIDALEAWHNSRLALYRHSKSHISDSNSVIAWLRIGTLLSDKINTDVYDAERFKQSLSLIRSFTKLENLNEAISLTVKLCAEAGVAFLAIDELHNTRLCGAARWLNKDKALIQLSHRHKLYDVFWFTFFHEAAHILLHGKKELFIDEEGQVIDDLEKEADNFAQNLLIPKDAWKDFVTSSSFDDIEIREFADKQGIGAGIVAGRLLHEKYVLHPHKLRSVRTYYSLTDDGKILVKPTNTQ